MKTSTLEAQSFRLCQERLAAMLEESPIDAVVLSGPQGRMIASACETGAIAGGDIAVMSHMMLSVADETASRRRNRVVCDLKGRPMIIMHPGELVLTVIGKPEANMGLVAGIAEQGTRKLQSLVRFDEQTERIPANTPFAFDADGFTEKVLADIEKEQSQAA